MQKVAHLADPVEVVGLVVAPGEPSPGEPPLFLVEAQRLGPDAGAADARAVGGLGTDARPALFFF